jgi:hypothetical protein
MTDAGADPSSAAALMAALGEVARLLEAGEAEAAAKEMGALVGRYPSVSAGTLGPEEIATARRLLERCRAAEGSLRKKVKEEMGQVGSSRKAHAAYR